MRSFILCTLFTIATCLAFAQTGAPGAKTTPAKDAPAQLTAADIAKAKAELAAAALREKDFQKKIDLVNDEGVEVQIESIAHYRGARSFQLSGIGLVVGLENTGDSNKSVATQTMYASYFKSKGVTVAPSTIDAKNVALVQVSAVMPAFTKPGSQIDITVSSIADAKSLQGGVLLLTPLYGPTDTENVIVSAEGPLSIGGFNATSSGSSVQRNHVNVGRVPGGGLVQTRIDSKVIFEDAGSRRLYLDLDETNPTTASRIVKKLNEKFPDLGAHSEDSTTISLNIPVGQDPYEVMSKVSQTTVFAEIPAKVVINERTGTIVVGGNVRLGPAMVVSGSLNVRIYTENDVSQPTAFSTGGTTTQVSNSGISAGQEPAKMMMLPPLATVGQLARLFQALALKPNDVIQILQLLKTQGALKARIETQ